MEEALLAQIEREPDRPIVLPDWAYWKEGDTAYVDRRGERISLLRHLYEMRVQRLGYTDGLANDIGVPARNVNPLLAVVLPTRWSKVACPKCGTRYRDEDYTPNVGQRCHACAERRRQEREKNRGQNAGQRNKAKTHCPSGHPYTKENTIRLRSGRRRCRTCHTDRMRLYRERDRRNDERNDDAGRADQGSRGRQGVDGPDGAAGMA